MPKKLTGTNIKDTYIGVIHAFGQPLPASGQVRLNDGVGNDLSLAIGQNSNGVTVYGSLTADNIKLTSAAGIIDIVYPVGSIYLTTNSANPSVVFPGTTWTQQSQGRYLAGVGTGNDGTTSKTLAAGNSPTSFKYEVQLTASNIPNHTHQLYANAYAGSDDFAWSANTNGWFGGTQGRAIYYSNINGGKGSLCKDQYARDVIDGGSQGVPTTPPNFAVYVWTRTA